ncbi:MAG: aspartate aminotransferase family protein [Longimicrobiales bacterium]
MTSPDQPPRLFTAVPGPRSRELARRLGRVESRNITCLLEPGPIFWSEAAGANVRDVDGNVFIDLTAGFGVAAAGHTSDAVVSAIAAQAAKLPHALGDVHPAEIKVALLERLAAIAPGDLAVSILASSGAEAVEAALKTARLRTGRPGVIAFEGAYHGLTYGALATTWRSDFRAPFQDQLGITVHFVPYPAMHTGTAGVERTIAHIEELLEETEASNRPAGAILVEPILGRGGIIPAAPGFLAGLRNLCDGESRLLIFDEIYSGCGRTGRWFACEHEGVVPDVLVIGKALTGSLPLSAAIGTPAVMDAWPPSRGEAIHTSTFLGNPIGCAAALAQLGEIERRGLLERATTLGTRVQARADAWAAQFDTVLGGRGVGLLQGVVVDERTAAHTVRFALEHGVLILAEGAGDVLAITPPAVITDAQLDQALDVIEAALSAR